MSRYAKIMPNDIVDGEGVCVSFWVQGCPFHCDECHNEETWDFSKGEPYTDKVKWEIIKLIGANGVQRNFSVLGGEPLAPQNIAMTAEIIDAVRHAYPSIKIFLWTGYTFVQLQERSSKELDLILNTVDVLIDGPYVKELRNLNLRLRGSENQHIRVRHEDKWEVEE